MTELPKGSPFEPDWMRELREIDQRIAAGIERYMRARRKDMLHVFLCGAFGVFFGALTIELAKWWVGLG